ncbi:hypothetical protein FHN55_16670 [Streptomyces sp. NP160]|uniref:B3/B4 domain-containing protein n=1 Tax=Streptomyces sp. NP160 TaxID=2586637 RepID=UPI0011199F30|nr:phenylalanine--tRNA ligase beta subunit-related protein [Streptomyces sp. NP160]TNM61945.1 hypothetical protein FHN55_16670 [Streptomyces sp. NP160]
MSTHPTGQQWLQEATVSEAVYALRPDYRALLVLAEDLQPGPSDASSEALLAAAEQQAATALAGGRPEDLAPLAAWRETYRAFGAKPQRTRPSVEALVRRVEAGLPRIDRITDTYNAISVSHLMPLGGEDADRYDGPPRLVRADGSEQFHTGAGGEPVVEHPEVGEVVWADAAGVTCRRWNWRQCTRTQIAQETTRALFILDSLQDVQPLEDLHAAAAQLQTALAAFSPRATFATRLLGPTG